MKFLILVALLASGEQVVEPIPATACLAVIATLDIGEPVHALTTVGATERIVSAKCLDPESGEI